MTVTGAALAAPRARHRTGQPASAYVATASGAVPAPGRGGVAPTASLSTTGFGAAESSLAIARDGTIFFAPAFTPRGTGVLRSRDGDATWTPLLPELPGGMRHGRMQPHMFMDPASERLFFYTALLSFKPPRLHPRRHRGFHMTWSDDQGDTWTYARVAEDAVDWAKMSAGPPVSSATRGYPGVLYLSAPSPISTPVPGIIGPRFQSIRRSLDGGRTWERVGKISLLPRDAGCHPLEWLIFGNGAVAPDGTLHLGLRRGPRLGVATSRDEGVTWTVRDVPGSMLTPYRHLLQILADPNYVIGELIAVDPAGSVYVVWPDADDRLRLSVSTDRGETWSRPVVASAPGVAHVRCGAVTARAPGTIAIAYYGSKDGVRYDGYVAESTDALGDEPSFWSATINDPAEPLYPRGFDAGYRRMFLGADLNEFVQVRYAPNGDLLAAFCKHMDRGDGWDYEAHARSKLQGVLGRLAHA